MAAAVPYIIAAVAAAGSIAQSQAAASAAKYNSEVAANNAEIARQQGAAAQEQQQRDSIRKIGAMRAGYGASGVELSGSPLDVLQDSVAQATLDGLTTKYNYEVRGQGFQSQSQLESSRANSISSSAMLNAAAEGGKAYAMSGGFKLPSGLSGSGDVIPMQPGGGY